VIRTRWAFAALMHEYVKYRRITRGNAVRGVDTFPPAQAMACPVCNPLAISIIGAAGALSFLAPYRGVIALLSIVLLAVTLLIRLRTTRACQLTLQPGPSSTSPR
jgi:hypothetical protein